MKNGTLSVVLIAVFLVGLFVGYFRGWFDGQRVLPPCEIAAVKLLPLQHTVNDSVRVMLTTPCQVK